MSKEDIEKLDKQIELLKKDNSGNPTGEVETVVTEIHDPNDENHVVNISYIDSEVKETTKELKDLKTITTGVESTNVEVSDDTKQIAVTKNLDAIEETLVEETSTKVESNNESSVNDKKSNKTLFIILGVIIGILILVFIICLFVFGGNNSKDTNKTDVIDGGNTDRVLSKEKMSEVLDSYGKALENEITKYYDKNNKLPDFSTINNLVNLEYEVVCHTHEIYEDKTVYLNECMVDYNDIDKSYGTKKEKVVEEVDTNNIKVYVHKTTKVPTLDEPVDKSNYYLYSSKVDSEIKNITILNKTVYLSYYDVDNNKYELYNYVTGKRAFYKIDYKSAAVVSLYTNNNYNIEYSSDYVILYFNNSKARVYNLTTGEAVSEEYDLIRADELSNDRLAVSVNGKWGMFNLKSKSLVIPTKYDEIYKSGSSIIAKALSGVSIFDADGNEYLDDFNIINTSAVLDKYVLHNKKMYNLSGKELCEFETENSFLIQNSRIVGDKLIYYVLEEQKNECYIYDVSEKACLKSSVDECNKIY